MLREVALVPSGLSRVKVTLAPSHWCRPAGHLHGEGAARARSDGGGRLLEGECERSRRGRRGQHSNTGRCDRRRRARRCRRIHRVGSRCGRSGRRLGHPYGRRLPRRQRDHLRREGRQPALRLCRRQAEGPRGAGAGIVVGDRQRISHALTRLHAGIGRGDGQRRRRLRARNGAVVDLHGQPADDAPVTVGKDSCRDPARRNPPAGRHRRRWTSTA